MRPASTGARSTTGRARSSRRPAIRRAHEEAGRGAPDGFFHGLGHGVGLEVHEGRGSGRSGTKLVAGDVVTIEPGLYRQGYGGVPPRGPRARHRGRRREPDALPVRPRALSVTRRRSTRCSSRSGAIRRGRVRRAGERAARDLRRATSRSSGRREGRERVTWFEPFTELYEWEPPYAKWYLGGKLNVCFNCVDRHVEAGRGDKVAFHWEGEPEGERARDHATRSCSAMSSASRTRSRSSASGRARRSRSTWAWFRSCRSRCSRARGSARRTRSSSAASRPTRSRTG